jgi:hypothetical protein
VATAESYELSPEETMQVLKKQVRRYLHMSVEEFLELMEAGTLPSHPAVPHLVMLADAGASR